MDVEFCIEALEEAMARFGKPGIFNTSGRDAITPFQIILTSYDTCSIRNIYISMFRDRRGLDVES